MAIYLFLQILRFTKNSIKHITKLNCDKFFRCITRLGFNCSKSVKLMVMMIKIIIIIIKIKIIEMQVLPETNFEDLQIHLLIFQVHPKKIFC